MPYACLVLAVTDPSSALRKAIESDTHPNSAWRLCTRTLRLIPLATKLGKMPPSQPVLRGQGHDLASFLLPTRLLRSRVALRHVARHWGQARPAYPTRASEVQAQAFHRAQ